MSIIPDNTSPSPESPGAELARQLACRFELDDQTFDALSVQIEQLKQRVAVLEEQVAAAREGK